MILDIKNNDLEKLTLNIYVEDFLKNQDRYYYLLNMYKEKFVEMELYYADELMLIANDFYSRKEFTMENPYLNGIYFSHKNGNALVRVTKLYTDKEYLVPFVEFRKDETNTRIDMDGTSLGYAFLTNQFHFLKRDYLEVKTKFLNPEDSLAIYWIFSQLEDAFYKDDIKYVTIGETYPLFQEQFESLIPTFQTLINRNRSKRIDTLKVDGFTLIDLIEQDIINTHKLYLNNQIYKLCVLYGKPFKQITSYLKNHNYENRYISFD